MREETSEQKVGWAIVGIAAVAAGAWIQSMAVADAWLWFVVPLGPPPITAGRAFGLLMLVSIVRGHGETRGPR